MQPSHRRRDPTKAVPSVSSSSTSGQAGQFGPNEWLVEEMYQRFLDDPTAVDPAWHDFFADYRVVDDDASPAEAVNGTGPVTPKAPPTRAPARTTNGRSATNGAASTAAPPAAPPA